MRVPCWIVLICFLCMILLQPCRWVRAQEMPWPKEPEELKTPIALIDLDARGAVSQDEGAMLSDRLRIELFRTGAFDVMERNKMKEILEEHKFQLSGCIDQVCAVQVGKLIGVQKMIAGSVGRIGDLYTVSLWMVDVESGRMEKTATRDYEGPVEELMRSVMRDLARGLAEIPVEEAAPPGVGKGDMYIVSEPEGAEVSVDGEIQEDVTPVLLSDLLQREYSLRVAKEGYEVFEETVTVRSGEIDTVAVQLTRRERSVFKRWWFWAIVGGAMAGGAVLVRGDGDGGSERAILVIDIPDPQ